MLTIHERRSNRFHVRIYTYDAPAWGVRVDNPTNQEDEPFPALAGDRYTAVLRKDANVRTGMLPLWCFGALVTATGLFDVPRWRRPPWACRRRRQGAAGSCTCTYGVPNEVRASRRSVHVYGGCNLGGESSLPDHTGPTTTLTQSRPRVHVDTTKLDSPLLTAQDTYTRACPGPSCSTS